MTHLAIPPKQRFTNYHKYHVLQPTTKLRTLSHHTNMYSTHALSSCSPLFFNIAPKLSQSISILSTPLWPTFCLRRAWLNRSGEWSTSPEPVWTASPTALGSTSVTPAEPWPETAKNITQSYAKRKATQIPWGRALRLFTLDCLTFCLSRVSLLMCLSCLPPMWISLLTHCVCLRFVRLFVCLFVCLLFSSSSFLCV